MSAPLPAQGIGPVVIRLRALREHRPFLLGHGLIGSPTAPVEQALCSFFLPLSIGEWPASSQRARVDQALPRERDPRSLPLLLKVMG